MRRVVLAAVWLGLAATAACVQPRPASGRTVKAAGSLEQAIHDRMAPDDAIAWSETRRLSWSDFQGQAPTGGEEGALTAYSLFQGLRCTGQTFEFRVVAAMLPHRSWVKPAVLADPALGARTLQHEQTHFDLTESYARRMRKYFAGLYAPCDQTEERLQASADRFVHDEAAEQDRYDRETRHGLIADRQQFWTRDVGQRLAER